MLEWFEEFWMYAVGLVVVFLITMFIFKKAIIAYSDHKSIFKEQEEKIKRLVQLKNKYQELNYDVIKSADDNELLEGVALSYQIKLQKSETQEKDFAQLCKEKQFIYALDVFVQDESEKSFFSENGTILKDIICDALELIGESSLSEKAAVIVKMHDENDEKISFNQNKVDDFYEYLSKHNICDDIKLKSARYIKENSEKFYNT